MAIIEINVDEKILSDAEEALNAIGMDVQIAFNVFLRRVALEKGLPMTMSSPAMGPEKQAYSSENSNYMDEEWVFASRTNTAITKTMVDEVWKAFQKYYKGLDEISRLRDEVAEKSGMSAGSAFIYLNILDNLVKGRPNTRTLKMKDLEYLLEKIRTELGDDLYENALQSLKLSIPYWRTKLAGNFANKVESYYNSKKSMDFR